ncbi:unnamed protein product [Cochlearia groenlandica]
MNAKEQKSSPCTRCCGLFSTINNKNLCTNCYKHIVFQQFSLLRLEPETEPSHASMTSLAAAEQTVATKPRCGTCERKVGLLGFNCRCGHVFCGSHRYPEEHSCPFDYKQSGRVALAKQLPLIRTDKLQKL